MCRRLSTVVCPLSSAFGWLLPSVLCLLLLGCSESRIREHYENAGRHQAAGDLAAASAEFHAILAIDSTRADAHYSLGYLFLERGRPDSALHFLDRAVAIDPAFADAHFKKGVLFASQGLVDSSIAAYRRAVAHDSRQFEAYNNLGVMLEGTGQVAAAIERYQAAIDANPGFAPAYANLARAALLAGDRDRAIKAAHRSVELGEGMVDGYNTLATAYVQTGEYDRALQFLEEAQRTAPDHPLVNDNLAYVREKKAERIAAKAAGEMRAAHIVVEKRDLAEVLAEKAKAGEDFALLARTHSIDRTGPGGGDLGPFKRGDMLPAFESLVRSLSPGQVGGPLQTPLGWHVVKRVY